MNCKENFMIECREPECIECIISKQYIRPLTENKVNVVLQDVCDLKGVPYKIGETGKLEIAKADENKVIETLQSI